MADSDTTPGSMSSERAQRLGDPGGTWPTKRRLAVALRALIDRLCATAAPEADLLEATNWATRTAEQFEAAGEVEAHCAMTSGTVYDKGSLSKLALDDLRSLFGTDFAKEVSTGLDLDVEKLAEVAHTLPRPEAELFDNLCQECGIAPAMSKGASAPLEFSEEDLEKLASSY